MDGNGKLEKLWQFSACFVAKSFKIIEASNESAFKESSLAKAEENKENIIIRAYASDYVTISSILTRHLLLAYSNTALNNTGLYEWLISICLTISINKESRLRAVKF